MRFTRNVLNSSDLASLTTSSPSALVLTLPTLSGAARREHARPLCLRGHGRRVDGVGLIHLRRAARRVAEEILLNALDDGPLEVGDVERDTLDLRVREGVHDELVLEDETARRDRGDLALVRGVRRWCRNAAEAAYAQECWCDSLAKRSPRFFERTRLQRRRRRCCEQDCEATHRGHLLCSLVYAFVFCSATELAE